MFPVKPMIKVKENFQLWTVFHWRNINQIILRSTTCDSIQVKMHVLQSLVEMEEVNISLISLDLFNIKTDLYKDIAGMTNGVRN